MQMEKAVMTFVLSAAALLCANAQMNPIGSMPGGNTGTGTNSGTNSVGTVPVPSNAVTNTDQILILSNFPGTNYLVLVAADSLLETQIGAIAQTNSSNSAVQQLGQTLVTDNTKTYNDAQTLASGMGISLRQLNDQEEGIVQRFESLSGNDFDRVFARYLIQIHIQDIGRHEVAAERSSNHDVRAYAATNLPVLVNHYNALLNIREGLLGNQALTQ
jgi:putative membrane protein